jgi:phage gp46-like protein
VSRRRVLTLFATDSPARIVYPATAAASGSAPSRQGDIALIWDPRELAADLATEWNDLENGDEIKSGVLLSLFLDRRAEAGDVLPDGANDHRGWWADEFADVDGDRIGSRLWLLSREKSVDTVARRAQEYAAEALQWMVDDGAADKIDVITEIAGRQLSLGIDVYRPGAASPSAYRFAPLWADVAGGA